MAVPSFPSLTTTGVAVKARFAGDSIDGSNNSGVSDNSSVAQWTDRLGTVSI
jgi:hypothetical protein